MKKFALALTMVFILVSISNIAFSQKSDKKVKGKTIEMKVGFHCGGGKATIEKTLAGLSGVKSYDVNLETKMVKVIYNPKETDTEKLAEAMLGLGYSVDGKEPEKKHNCVGH